jgi:hypothetical protein
MKVSFVVSWTGAIALLLVLAPAAVAQNPLGLSDSSQQSSSQSAAKKPAAKKSSWFPFSLFESSADTKPAASPTMVKPVAPKGPSISDRVSASFAKMNADTKRMMTKTATGLGLKKKPAPAPSPFGNLGGYGTSTSSKSKKKSSGFSWPFGKPDPGPPETVGEFLSLPRPGDNSGF